MTCRQLLTEYEEMFERLGREKFDLAIVEAEHEIKHTYLIAHRLGVPWISMTPIIEPWFHSNIWYSSIFPSSLVTLNRSEELRGTPIGYDFELNVSFVHT